MIAIPMLSTSLDNGLETFPIVNVLVVINGLSRTVEDVHIHLQSVLEQQIHVIDVLIIVIQRRILNAQDFVRLRSTVQARTMLPASFESMVNVTVLANLRGKAQMLLIALFVIQKRQ